MVVDVCTSERPLGFLALAAGLPLAMLAVHHGLGHAGDIAFFHDWYLAFRRGPAFYRDGPGLNYPIVGVLAVCGPALAVERVTGAPLDLDAYRWVLKGTLVAAEIGMILAAAALARALGARHPKRLALALYLLPSTLVGGAWFGQTDVLGTALLLGAAAALVRFHRDGRTSMLGAGLAALVLAVLAKQLTWFAVPPLALLAVSGLRKHGTPARWAMLALAPLLVLVPDPFLTLPDGFSSHVAFVVAGGGSSHGDLAVASGASVWSLFVPGGTPARDVHVLGLGSLPMGIIAWLAAQGLAGYQVLRAPHDRARALVWWAGIAELSMATLLTGVHERYLAHAIPLLFLADASAPTWRRALGISVAVLSGLFVLSTLSYDAFDGPLAALRSPVPLAIAGLAWLVASLATGVSGRAAFRPARAPRIVDRKR